MDIFHLKKLVCFVLIISFVIAQTNLPTEDRLQIFYDRLKQSDVKYCPDKTKLLPNCVECIPGLEKSAGSETCDKYVKESVAIRSEIGALTSTRYGAAVLKSSRPYGLYPYLEGRDFIIRQQIFGTMLSESQAMNILDIGAYYNPINLFLKKDFCPTTVIIVEPILNALSVIVPCKNNIDKKTHFIFLPITFKYYLKIKSLIPKSDSVVCIGCDSHYGPNRELLETSFEKPYKLFLEYPSEYVHNKAFKKMMGNGE
jgi:hypothetical protein